LVYGIAAGNGPVDTVDYSWGSTCVAPACQCCISSPIKVRHQVAMHLLNSIRAQALQFSLRPPLAQQNRKPLRSANVRFTGFEPRGSFEIAKALAEQRDYWGRISSIMV